MVAALASFMISLIASQTLQADETAKITGVWEPVSAEFAGQPFSPETLKTMKLILKADGYSAKVGDVIDEGKLKLDTSKTPKTMDIIGTLGPNKDKTFLAIYELNGDTLRICYDLSEKSRPTEFKSAKDSQLLVASYKRVKP